MAKKKKAPRVAYDHLALELSGYKASIDAAINYDARDKRFHYKDSKANVRKNEKIDVTDEMAQAAMYEADESVILEEGYLLNPVTFRRIILCALNAREEAIRNPED